MEEENLIRLPSKDKMEDLLIETCTSSLDHRKDHFFPMLLKHAGSNLTPDELVILYVEAIAQYLAHMPKNMQMVVMGNLFYDMDRFIERLIPHEHVKDEVYVGIINFLFEWVKSTKH